MTQQRYKSRVEHELKHRLLRRLCYKFVRDELPEVWEELKIEVGIKSHKRRKEMKKK